MDAFALLCTGNSVFDAGSFQFLAIDGALHQSTGSQNSQALVAVTLGFICHLNRNMQPGTRGAVLDQIECLMNRVDRSDQKICTRSGQFFRSLRSTRFIRHSIWSDRKSTRLNSSHQIISYAVFCLKKKNTQRTQAKQILPPKPVPLPTTSRQRP